jgi:hypothetical protein
LRGKKKPEETTMLRQTKKGLMVNPNIQMKAVVIENNDKELLKGNKQKSRKERTMQALRKTGRALSIQRNDHCTKEHGRESDGKIP